MRDLRYLIAFLTLSASVAVQGIALGQDNPKASYRLPEQLKGLKSITLIIDVISLDIPKNAMSTTEVEQKAERLAEKMIRKAGLSLKDERHSYLGITVYAYRIDEKTLPDHLIIQVRTELHEEAILKRNPALEDQYFTTWDYDWVELVSLRELESFILKEVEDQVEEFCRLWQWVNDKERQTPQ